VITAVHLENWRAYTSFSLDLEPGTTFLVAANGVGKTSFIDAVRWALDPDAKATKTLMRRRAKRTSVEVELIAGRSRVRIRRTLTLGRAKAPKPEAKAWIDDEEAELDAALRQLAESWGVDSRFASRAAFMTDRLLYGEEGEPDLRAHLTRLHSLDHVQAAVESIDRAMRDANEAADSARKATSAGEADLQAAMADAATATEQLRRAETAAEALRTAATETETELGDAERSNKRLEALYQWMSERQEIVAEAAVLLPAVPDDTDLRPLLRSAEEDASRRQVERAARRAALDERLSVIEEALDRLHDAGAECPVCRRPLDADSRGAAEARHSDDLAFVREQLLALERDEETPSLVDRLRTLLRRADALGDRPTDVETEPIDLGPLGTKAAAARSAFEDALEQVGRAKRAVGDANGRVQQIRADVAARSSVSLYARVATLEAAKAALEATITRVLEAQLGPVSDEVNRRWEAIFPDRPGLRLDSAGRITRSFEDDDDDLPFESFSSGERVVAKLLLRLATLTSTTDVPFWLIDEPLEHLDPDARSYVARTLAHLGSGGGLRQIFVTTYEEDLALQLAGGAGDHVRLDFLRTTHFSS
jgi:DNA repair exonuclease SbcCD ATPase subunit